VGWHITFGKKDYLSMKQRDNSPQLQAMFEGGMRRVRSQDLKGEQAYAEFQLKADGDCPLHREDCLCALQVEHGAQALPQVCQTFPRGQVYYDELERSLTPACEAVLNLLWDLPEGVEFRSDALEEKEKKNLTYTDPSDLRMAFPVVRSLCISLLQDRRFPLTERILLMGMMLRQLCEGKQDVPVIATKYHDLLQSPAAEELARSLSSLTADTGKAGTVMYLSSNLRLLLGLNSSDPAMMALREQVLAAFQIKPLGGTTINFDNTVYEASRARFEEKFEKENYFFENLAVMVWFHLGYPHMNDEKTLWQSYVNFCNLMGFYRFMCTMTCREGVEGEREDVNDMIVLVSRSLLHNRIQSARLRDELFNNESSTLAHMAILLGG
jgi:hypothetical protein